MRHHGSTAALAGEFVVVVALLCAASPCAAFAPINKTALAAKVNATKQALMAEVGVKLNGVTVDESAPHIIGEVSCYIDANSGNVIGLQVGPRGKVLCSNAGTRRTFNVPANGYIANVKMAVDKENGLIGELAFTIKSDDAVSLVTCGTAGGAPLSVTPPLSAVAAFSAGCQLIAGSVRPPRNAPGSPTTNGGAGRRRRLQQVEPEATDVETAAGPGRRRRQLHQAHDSTDAAVAVPTDDASPGRRRRHLLANQPKTSLAINPASLKILVTTISSPGAPGGGGARTPIERYAYISDPFQPPYPSVLEGGLFECPIDALSASSDACRLVPGFGGVNAVGSYINSSYVYTYTNLEVGNSPVPWGTVWICRVVPRGLPETSAGCTEVTGFNAGQQGMFSTPTATYVLNNNGSPWICPSGVFTSVSDCTLTSLPALNSELYMTVVGSYAYFSHGFGLQQCNLALTQCTDYSSAPVYNSSPTYAMTPGVAPNTVVIS